MAAVVFNRKEIGITETGSLVDVPDNDTAKLMYYLSVLCSVLRLEDTDFNIERLSDYKNYYMLTEDEIVTLVLLCGYLSPDKMVGKCIFNSEELCQDVGNRFFTLNSSEVSFAAAENVFVGAAEVTVKKIMVYSMSWMRKNYINPISKMLGITPTRNQQAITYSNRPAISTRSATPQTHRNTTRNNDDWYYTSTSESLDCCVIL
ncbi:unnamed protein product [Mytilus coruscus]|uniref:Uncharacterized protein n=1 Tax=Mytilus coruscus TaxID=42192 RepID=A0A6J8EAH0_MYTCO|nr:unnamed protein product [Mytilus coruscus]